MQLRASIDLMGGDHAPHIILEAAEKFQDIHFHFFGTAECEKIIDEYVIAQYTFHKCEFALTEGKKFSKSDLEKSSLYASIHAVKEKIADFVISGGPSGYYLLLCRQILGTLTSISRPAIATSIPTIKNFAIMMDLGANTTCDEDDLVKFAIMGTSLAQFWINVKKPKVGFLNVGAETGKGPDLVKNAAAKFSQVNQDADCSFVEGHYVMQGTHDVIIADGFVGNCILKFGEGAFIFFKETLKRLFSVNIFYKLLGLFLKKKMRKILIDPRKYNGAIFAGINGCAVKSHGGSDAFGFECALRFAIRIGANKDEMLAKMEKDLQHFSSQMKNAENS
jgi:glycerol-3-phosphate acyltransferase PlsX